MKEEQAVLSMQDRWTKMGEIVFSRPLRRLTLSSLCTSQQKDLERHPGESVLKRRTKGVETRRAVGLSTQTVAALLRVRLGLTGCG